MSEDKLAIVALIKAQLLTQNSILRILTARKDWPEGVDRYYQWLSRSEQELQGLYSELEGCDFD